MRVVIDTNVLVSYLFWPDHPARAYLNTLLQAADILRSTETFAELSEVVMRKKFDPYLPIPQREIFLAAFYDMSAHIVIEERIQACRDSKDDKFLELAVAGGAKLIITGDKGLLALNPFRDILIVDLATAADLA